MELQAIDGMLLVLHRHDDAIIHTFGEYFQFVGKALFLDYQRMVTHDLWGSDPLEKRVSVMCDHGGFTVLQRFCTNDIPAISIPDGLMPKTDS